MELTQEYLQSIFEYHANGFLTWKQTYQKSKIGKVAGHFEPKRKYYWVKINKKIYGLHRIIFLHQNGWMPSTIDHIDRNPSNNKIENLRPVSISQNSWNSNLFKTNTSGIRGVNFSKSSNAWEARIAVNKKRICLGLFKNKQLAIDARIEAEIFYYGIYSPQWRGLPLQ
jgi:hypothetical protein